MRNNRYFTLKLGVVLIFLFASFSCGKKSINGILDGRWQLMTIDFHEDGEQIRPDYTYYDFALHLMQFRKTYGTDAEFGYLNGRFNHIDDSMHVMMIRCTKDMAVGFGMNDTIQHFAVEELTGKKMILNSEYARLNFRKF